MKKRFPLTGALAAILVLVLSSTLAYEHRQFSKLRACKNFMVLGTPGQSRLEIDENTLYVLNATKYQCIDHLMKQVSPAAQAAPQQKSLPLKVVRDGR